MLCPMFCQDLHVYLFGFFWSYYNSSVFSVNPDYKCEISVSLHILEGTDSRASSIMDYFPQLVKIRIFGVPP